MFTWLFSFLFSITVSDGVPDQAPGHQTTQVSSQASRVTFTDTYRQHVELTAPVVLAVSERHLNSLVYILIAALGCTILAFTLLVVTWLKKYRSLVRTVRELQGSKLSLGAVPQQETSIVPLNSVPAMEEQEDEEPPPQTQLHQISTVRAGGSRRLWKGLQQHVSCRLSEGPRFTKSDLNLLQLIKAGKEGVFYQARMSRGTCKGHSLFTCKISKEGVRPKHVDTEVSIMKKLVHHKNILQLLDWNTTEEPYILIMEYVSCGTLRTFLQTNRVQLSADPELQSLLTITSYHIALAMQHLRSKMRRVPLRWYPPEYFRSNYYGFKGDVWAFGIVLWEMQTFGTLPYPNLETSEAVMYHICIGHKNTNPEGCRPEILHIMRDCWLEPYTLRPSFTDVVNMLEEIIDNDADYVDVESSRTLVKEEAEVSSIIGEDRTK
ncbi:hypothetical protein PAMP_019083 [Pampus punctatissimus]